MLNKMPPIAVPFVGGLDTKADPKMTPMGSFQVLENAVFTEHGSIKKRWGYNKKLPTSMEGGQLISYYGTDPLAAPHSAISLSKWNGAMLLNSDRDIFAWSSAAGKWVNHGFSPAISVDTDRVPEVVGEQTMGDSITNGILTAYIWEDSREGGEGIDTGVRTSIVDSQTGFVYVYDYELDGSGIIPRCGLVGDKIILIWCDTTANTLQSIAVSNTDPAGSVTATPNTFASTLDVSDTYDVVVSQERTFVACLTTQLEVHELGPDGDSSLSNTRDVATEFSVTVANLVHITIAHVYGTGGPNGTRLLNINAVGATGAGGFWARQYADNLQDHSGDTWTCTTSGTVNNMSLVQLLGASADNSIPGVVYEIDGTQAWNSKVVLQNAHGSTVLHTVRHSGLASRGSLIGDAAHTVLVHTSPGLQNCYMLYDWISEQVVARISYGDASAAYSKGQLPGLYSGDGVTFGFTALVARRISSLGAAFEADADPSGLATFDNSALARYTFEIGGRIPAVEVGSSTYSLAGDLRAYNGVTSEESAPLLFPEDVTIADDASGTHSDNLVLGSTYLYRVYYERVRPNGEETRSLALTWIYTVGQDTAVANTNSELTLPYLSHTAAQTSGDWRIAVYRTEANKTDLFYLVTNPDLTDDSAPNNYIPNDATGGTVTFLDDMADADLIKMRVDPQSQGVLPVVQPAPAKVIGEAGGRVFLAGGEYDTGVIAPSLLVFPGEPVLFSDELRFSVEEEGGEIEAMGALDGVLVAFKEKRVYAVSGQGPSDTGIGQDFNVQRVTTDVGCTSPGSIVETPEGLMFQSAKGLYIINRSFDTEYVGWPVEIFNEQCIVSAEVIPDSNIVVFLTSDGQSLSYDYFFKQWSTWTGHTGLDAVVIGDDYHYLRSDSKVYTRDEDAYLDAGQWYSMRLRTAPIRLDSIQDYMRVRRLNIVGEYLSSHRLQMKVFNNRDPFPFETRIFEPDNVIDITLWGDADTALWGDADTELWGGTAGDTDYQFQHKFKRQKVQYLRLEFQDLQSGAAPGQSYELAEMNFDIGVYDRNARIPAGRKL